MPQRYATILRQLGRVKFVLFSRLPEGQERHELDEEQGADEALPLSPPDEVPRFRPLELLEARGRCLDLPSATRLNSMWRLRSMLLVERLYTSHAEESKA